MGVQIVIDSRGSRFEGVYIGNNCPWANDGAWWFVVPETGSYTIEISGTSTLSRPRIGTYELKIDDLDELLSPEDG
jgi:hypothetical protein